MLEILNFIFQSFWHFAGLSLLLSGVGKLIFSIWNRFLRHWTILKHGYPPTHCDADGDFKTIEKEKV